MGQNVNIKKTDDEGYQPKRIPQALKVIQARSFSQSEGNAVTANGSIQTLRGMKMVGVKCVGLMHFGELIPAATYQLMEQLGRIPNRIHPVQGEADFEMDLCVPIELNLDSYMPERVPTALRVLQKQPKSEVQTMIVEDMKPQIVEHSELKLIGIPCISLNDMSGKYHHAKEALVSSTKHLPSVKNPSIQYGIWPQVPTQQQSDMHAYILSVEVESFDGIPEWYFRTTLPPQKCVVVSNKNGDFDAASHVVDQYISDNGITVGADDRKYVICERYSYEGEGFARYSLPIQSTGENHE